MDRYVELSLLNRRSREPAFARQIALALEKEGRPGQWEEAAGRLGLPWERFLLLATTPLPRSREGLQEVATCFNLSPGVTRLLLRGRLPGRQLPVSDSSPSEGDGHAR